jgi:hypothetical protein
LSNEQYFAFAREFGGRIVLIIHQEMPAADRERKFEELLDDPGFQGYLALRYYVELDMAKGYSDLTKQAEAILTQVQKQLRE